MSARRRLALLVALAVLLTGAVGGVTGSVAYRGALAHNAELLETVLRSHAAFAEAVFLDELAELDGDTVGAVAAMLAQLRRADVALGGFGQTGEFTVARRAGDTIVFEIGLGEDTARVPPPIVLPSPLATPMQKALAGVSGVSEETDYDSTRVLAAYAALPGTGLAMVAKIDLWDIRGPHVRAVVIATLMSALLLLGTLAGGWRIARGLLAEVEEREDAHRALLEDFPGVIFRAVAGSAGAWRFQVLEGAVEEITGVPAERFLAAGETWRRMVHPEDLAAFDGRFARYFDGVAPEGPVDYRLVRPDGRTVWVRVQARPRRTGLREGGAGATLAGAVVDVTPERRAEEVRRRAEADLQALVRNLPRVGVHVLDRELRIRFSGGEAVHAAGLAHEAVVGRLIAEVLGPELAGSFLPVLERVLAGSTEHTDARFGGRVFEVTASPLPAPDGAVERILVLSLDVTESRAREAERAATEARFQAFMDASPTVAWIKDADGRHMWVNRAWEAELGLRREDWLGKTVHDLMDADAADELRRHDMEVLKTGEPLAWIEDTGELGGTRHVWQSVKFPLVGPEGQTFVGGIAVDITRERASEQALRESEDRFRRAVESSPDAIFIHTGGRFAYLNPAALALFGAERPDQLLGQPVLERHIPADREAVAARIRQVSQERRATPHRAESVVRLDGTLAWAEFTGVPFHYQGEDGGLVFAREVTERLQAERRIRDQLDELRRWQAVMLAREGRVQELKREVNDLCRRMGEEPRYPSQEETS